MLGLSFWRWWYIKYVNEDLIQPDNESRGAKDKPQPSENGSPTISTYTGEKDSEEYAPTSYTHQKRRKRKPLTCFEICMIVLSALGILVAAGTGIAIVWQDVIARYAIEAQTRPWVTIDSMTPDEPTVSGTSVYFKIGYTLKNYGNSPALNVSAEFDLLRDWHTQNRLFEQYPVCKNAMDDLTNEKSKRATAVFPTIDGLIHDERTLEKDNMRYRTLIGCIAYLGPDRKIYCTRFLYYIPPPEHLTTASNGTQYWTIKNPQLVDVEPD